jgi:hypothetical protein
MRTPKNLAALGVAAMVACSAPVDGGPDFKGQASGQVAGNAIGFVDDSTTYAPAVCSGQVFESERLPLDIYFLVDSSGSMAEPASGGGSKWDLVTTALVDFLNQSSTAQIGVGLGFFPAQASADCTANPGDCLCIPFINICFANIGGSCNAQDYAQPLVPLALPSMPQRLIDGIRAQTFSGGTPTRPALEGTYAYLDSWTALNPGRKVVAVLATDGDPAGCNQNQVADVAALAASALAGPSALQTFVIGVGGKLDALNQIARAGGTSQAFLTGAGGDLGAEFSNALESIRTAAGACTLAIPERTESGRVSPDQVNIRYKPNDGGEAKVIPMTTSGSAADCGTVGGWHYDNPAAPTRIQLCDTTCQASREARVEVEFGCQTIVR